LVDEQTQQLEATTGVVLTLGDELRPTGTDRGLLRRIAEQSGGKLRDTLAGVFLDRDALRFAYTPLSAWLLWLAGLALLLAVAARRFSVPEPLERAWQALRSPPAVVMPAAAAPAPEGTKTALGALRRLRGRKPVATPPVLASDPPSASPPRFSRPPPLPTPAPLPSPAAVHSSRLPAASPNGPAAPAARQPTAAEILLARRRGRRP
jgi:hypothetical protein